MSSKPVNIKDVAARAGVALATVDRVIHNRSGVSNKTREKVLNVIRELNYQPNILARNLVLNKTYHFGLLLPKPLKKNDYWQLPAQGATTAVSELSQYGIDLQEFLFDPKNEQDFKKQLLSIINSKIDGLVTAPKFKQELELLLTDCREKQIPYVFIDAEFNDEHVLSNIFQPVYESGQLAGQLFRYCLKTGNIIVLEIFDDMDDAGVLQAKFKGLFDFFNTHVPGLQTRFISIKKNTLSEIKNILDPVIDQTSGIFVLNSKTEAVAKYLKNVKKKEKLLIGYDLLKSDYQHLEDGTIDFLICQKPIEQGYRAINNLYDKVVLNKNVTRQFHMSIDIITKNNCKFYNQ
jgi:LacI family transcriptional regulator